MQLLLICLCLMNSSVVFAQERAEELPRCLDRDAMLYRIAKNTASDKSITVVARLGEGETRPNLNLRRLHNVRTYWTEFLNEYKRSPDSIILMEGEKVKDYGRLEFYVDGSLIAMLKLNRNADLIAVGCSAGPDEAPCPSYERNFYPCRDRYSKRRKNHSLRRVLYRAI
jgi:hypothetical protein